MVSLKENCNSSLAAMAALPCGGEAVCERRRVCFITGRREQELAGVREIGRNVTGVPGDVSNLAIWIACSHNQAGEKTSSISSSRMAGCLASLRTGQDKLRISMTRSSTSM